MAKGKPSRAFLEALKPDKKPDKKQDTKRPADDKAGGGFKTPEWFFKTQESQTVSTPGAASNTAPRGAMALGLAPTRRPFRFNWVYGAGAGVILLGVTLVAYMAGKQQQPLQGGPSSAEILQSPLQGGVLEPVARTVVAAPAPIAVAVQGGPGAVVAAEAGARIIGMNYVVIQSYKDRPLADEAAAAMVAGGLGCTVEPGLAGYSATWNVVVGTTPFTKATTPEYQAYLKKVQQISEKFAGNSKWKRFEPNPYKWR